MAIIIPTTGIGDTTPSVATEEIGGTHYQLVKLYTGTTGAAQAWDAGITTGQVVVRNLTTGNLAAVVTNVVPGTTTNDLGKALGGALTTGAVGVLMLGKHEDEATVTTVTTGQYAYLSLSELSELRTRDQRAYDFQKCNNAADWTALNTDTANIADSTNHVFGTGAVSFDKVNSAADTVYACIYDTISAINVAEVFEAGGFTGMAMYLSDITNVVNVFLRLGTDGSNYNQWTWLAADLTAATWLSLRTEVSVPDHANNAGNGWNPAAVTYVAVGVTFANETNTLAGILVDHIYAVGGRVTSTDISSNVSITTPNINLARVSNSPTGVAGNGAVGAGTQRVTIANDSTGVISVTTGNVVVRNLTTGSVSAIVANWPTTQSVTGNINVLNFPSTYTVTGYTAITTGQVSVPNVVSITGYTAITTGQVSVPNVVSVTGSFFPATAAVTGYVNITTGQVYVPNVVSVTGYANITTGNVSAQVRSITTGTIAVENILTGNLSVTARDLTTGNVVVRNITTGTVNVENVSTGNVVVRNLTTGQVSAVVANWPASQTVTGYVVITTGQVSIPNVVNVTGSLSAAFDSTSMIVNNITTGYVAANIVNTVSVTGTFSSTFDTTAMSVVNFPSSYVVTGYVAITTGQVSIPNAVSITGYTNITTGQVSIPNVVTVTGNFWGSPASVTGYVNITTGQVSIPNVVSVTGNFWGATTPVTGYVNITTGQVSVPNVVNVTGNFWGSAASVTGYVNITTGQVYVPGTVSITGYTNITTGQISVARVTTGNITVDNLTTANVSVANVSTGNIQVIPYGDKANYIYAMTTNIGNTTIAIVLTSQGASVGSYITHMLVTNAHTSVGTYVDIMNGATTAYRGFAAANGGGWSATFPAPLPGAANNPWSAKCETSGASVAVSMSGYKGAA